MSIKQLQQKAKLKHLLYILSGLTFLVLISALNYGAVEIAYTSLIATIIFLMLGLQSIRQEVLEGRVEQLEADDTVEIEIFEVDRETLKSKKIEVEEVQPTDKEQMEMAGDRMVDEARKEAQDKFAEADNQQPIEVQPEESKKTPVEVIDV